MPQMNSILQRLLLVGVIIYLVGCNQGSNPSNDISVHSNGTTTEGVCTTQNDAFWQAVTEGNVQDVSRYIENEGINVNVKNDNGTTPLHRAVLGNSNIDITKYLIEKGANVNAKDSKGWTPFHYVAIKIGFGSGHEMATLLLENGADVYAKNNDGETPLDLICEMSELFRDTTLDFFREQAKQGNPGAKEALQRLEKIRQ